MNVFYDKIVPKEQQQIPPSLFSLSKKGSRSGDGPGFFCLRKAAPGTAGERPLRLNPGAALRPPDTPGRWAPPGLSAAPALRRPPAIRNSRPVPAPPGAGPGNPPPAPGSSPRVRGKGRRRIGLKKLRTFTKGSQLGHDLAVFFGYDTDVPKGNGRNHKYLLLFSLSQK